MVGKIIGGAMAPLAPPGITALLQPYFLSLLTKYNLPPQFFELEKKIDEKQLFYFSEPYLSTHSFFQNIPIQAPNSNSTLDPK